MDTFLKNLTEVIDKLQFSYRRAELYAVLVLLPVALFFYLFACEFSYQQRNAMRTNAVFEGYSVQTGMTVSLGDANNSECCNNIVNYDYRNFNTLVLKHLQPDRSCDLKKMDAEIQVVEDLITIVEISDPCTGEHSRNVEMQYKINHLKPGKYTVQIVRKSQQKILQFSLDLTDNLNGKVRITDNNVLLDNLLMSKTM